MPYGCEGNRRSGSVALAMHHRLEWFTHLWAQGLRKSDEQPAHTPSMGCSILYHFTAEVTI